jgi:branched-subunit amino acid ABC-type transport system permease component
MEALEGPQGVGRFISGFQLRRFDMLPSIAVGAVIYACIMILLCVGFSLTHMMKKFLNFAHAEYASIGTMFTYSFVRLWGCNPYLVWPLVSLLGGVVGVALYL